MKTKAGLDYESKDTYTVTVTATDQSGLSDTDDGDGYRVERQRGPGVHRRSDGLTFGCRKHAGGPGHRRGGGGDRPDTGDTLTYTLEGDDAASFAIDGATGQLKTRDPLDYEFKASYSVTVSVSDGKDIDGNNDPSADNTIDVTITVTDLDEAWESNTVFPAAPGRHSVDRHAGRPRRRYQRQLDLGEFLQLVFRLDA